MKTNNLDPSWYKEGGGGGGEGGPSRPFQRFSSIIFYKVLKETSAKQTSMKNTQGGIIKFGI